MTDTDNRPTPDPTVLTTEQLLREVAGAVDLVETRLKGIEDVMAEKFRSVDTQFGLVERQRVEQKKDTKDAVDAALAAAKEAVKEQTTASGLSITKSETATSEQLKQLTTTFNTAIAGLTLLLNDLKTRVERIENIKQGASENSNALATVIGIVLSAAIVGIALYAAFHK